MTRTRTVLVVICWVLAVLGGGWAMLTLLAGYMTTTGYLHNEDVLAALPLPISAIFMTLLVHFWPKGCNSGKVWPWCVPPYIIAGGPLLLLGLTWVHQ
ncbi:MAG: hypothetical protein C5B50_19455 [Verrucomicrobia bacterium]|nr:MAG: hypothetical protein C5B50_19455 [Verrucomicrobiota bacterium]